MTNHLHRFYPPEFDFIHTRITIGCWSDMKTQIIQRAFDHLRPGGWFECQEVPAGIDSDDGTLTEDYGWARWVREFRAGSSIADRQVDNGPQIKEWMREIGFVDVHEVVIKLPMNGWPKDGRLKQLGMMWQKILMEGVSGFSLRTFNRSLNQTVEEIEVSVDESKMRGNMMLILTLLFSLAFTCRRAKEFARPLGTCIPHAIRRLRPETGRGVVFF